MQKILLIINSKASQGEGSYEQIAGFLQDMGFAVVKGECKTPEDYTKLIKSHEEKIDMVVVGGGDGTLRCAVDGLRKSKLPVGIIPLGTANNVARSLQIPMNARQACEIISRGKTAPMDLAEVNGKIFVSVLGIGLSTKVHEDIPDEQKKRWGALSYFMQALRSVREMGRGFRAKIKFDGKAIDVRAVQITVCNGKYYGAHVEISPDANLSDSMLDLSVIEAKKYYRGFFKAVVPWHTKKFSPGLKLLRAKTIEIDTHPRMKIDVEGTPEMQTPAKITVLPSELQVFVP